MGRSGAGPHGDGGFTLLETLVAFVIAALALGALTQAAGGGLQSARVAAHVQEALSRARSRLAAASLAPVPGDQGGDDGGGYAWRVTTARLDATQPARGAAQPAQAGAQPNPASAQPGQAGAQRDQATDRPGAVLYSVRVVVSWSLDGGTRQVVLDTRRVGPAPPPQAP